MLYYGYKVFYYTVIISRRYRTVVGGECLGRRWRRPRRWRPGFFVVVVISFVVAGVVVFGGRVVGGHRRPAPDACVVTAKPRRGRVDRRRRRALQQQRHAGQPQRAGHGGTRSVHGDGGATGEHAPYMEHLQRRYKMSERRYACCTSGIHNMSGSDIRGTTCVWRRRLCVVIKRARRHVQSVRRSAPM